MTEKDLLLAIDNGTQSLKALVFDLEGQLLAREQVTFTPYYSAHPGWAEQDPDAAGTGIETFGVFPHHHVIDVADLASGKRARNTRHQPYRAQVDVLVKVAPEVDQ